MNENAEKEAQKETTANGEAEAAEAQNAQEKADTSGQEQAGSSESGQSKSSQEDSSRPRQPTYIETLERRLMESEEKLREYINAYKQVKEDKDDFKRRLEREALRQQEITKGRLVSGLLDVLDNLDRSIQGGESGWNAESILAGLKLVQGQFMEKLTELGLKSIDPLGRPFNPNEAEALDMAMTTDEALDNTVSRVYQRGFMLGERVVRPARVQVARYVPGASA